MQKRVVGWVCVGVLATWMARPVAVRAQEPIPCTPIVSEECMTNYTCQTEFGFTFCGGQPAQDGTPCTQNTDDCTTGPLTCQDGTCKGTVQIADGTTCTTDGSGGCMSATCQQGLCVPSFGTPPAADGTPCNVSGNKCLVCKVVVPGLVSACTDLKACDPPSDPCKQSTCNPTDGSCVVGDKCFTFSGCETCNAGTGTCQPVTVNTGKQCANSEGDFNPCTTNDVCVLQSLGVHTSICMGVPISGMVPTSTPSSTPATTSTPTVTPSMTPKVSKACTGDCNRDGQVTVDEEITMSGIVLNDEPASACPSDHPLTIDDVVAGGDNVLNGCPQ
jgi:hypothetical protein